LQADEEEMGRRTRIRYNARWHRFHNGRLAK